MNNKSLQNIDYQAFVFDVDGTLENSRAEVLPATIAVLKKAHADYGKYLILCTGRPFFDIKRLVEKLPFFSYAICNNGGYYYNLETKEFTFKHLLTPAMLAPFLALAKKYDTVMAIHSEKNVYRFRSRHAILPHILADPHHDWANFPNYDDKMIADIINNERITQFSIRGDNELVSKLYQEMLPKSKDVSLRIAGGDYLDVNPAGVSKLEGLREVAAELKLDVSQFVAFGDSGNDLEMLSGVGLGICMGNGTPEAKAAAKEVIGTNDTDAIAKRVQELLIKGGS